MSLWKLRSLTRSLSITQRIRDNTFASENQLTSATMSITNLSEFESGTSWKEDGDSRCMAKTPHLGPQFRLATNINSVSEHLSHGLVMFIDCHENSSG